MFVVVLLVFALNQVNMVWYRHLVYAIEIDSIGSPTNLLWKSLDSTNTLLNIYREIEWVLIGWNFSLMSYKYLAKLGDGRG